MTTPININNASLDELKGITGISDRRAQKIIKLREEKGFPLKREDLKLMSDISNTMLDSLIQNGEVTLEQEEDYRAEKGKVIELMSSGQERIKTLERYNAELKAEFCILQKQNTLMQAEFEQKLIEMSVDFKIKIKNQIQEFDKLQEATEKKTDKKYRDC
jgi:competence ComEA-like helix-hairpin-helix protein